MHVQQVPPIPRSARCFLSFTCSVVFFLLFAKEQIVVGQPSSDTTSRLVAVELLSNQTVRLDGQLNEVAWTGVEPASDFRQREPREGAAPTEPTQVHVVYDKEALYIGAVLYDSQPEEILAYQRGRDASLATDDRFMWILDTFNDGRSAYFFEVNPAGLMGDGLLSTGQGFNLNKSWDGIWEAQVTQNTQGWVVEVRIPFRTLNFDPEQSTWGVNFQRTIRRRNEEILWNGYRRNQSLFRPQDAGELVGLNGLSQGVGLELVPYAMASAVESEERGRPPLDPVADAGFDINYSLTTNLRTALTVNTDFAETEVDQRRVNLTRFPLFFPEKRDFFLEGAGVFQFAPRSNVHPYFSRRIGLQKGEPIPVQVGGRLTGQAGAYELGFLQVRTGAAHGRPAEDFTVARVRKNVLNESTLGIIYTRRSTHSGDGVPSGLVDRHTLGTDFEFSTSRFAGDKNLQFQAFFVGHNAPLARDSSSFWDRTTRGGRIAFPNRPWYAHASYREFGKMYNPAVGFAHRNGYRRFQPSFEYAPLVSGSRLIRELQFGYRFEYLTDMKFRPQTTENRWTVLGVEFESGDELETNISRSFERLNQPFDIRHDGSIVLPAGGYSTWTWGIEGQTAGYRRVAGSAGFSDGGFWSGTRTRYAAGLDLRPWTGLNLSGSYSYSKINLQEGRFDAHLVRISGDLDLTPWIAFTTNLQYDNLSKVVGLFSRFRWTVKPGSDLYLVYTHNWRNDPVRLRSLEQQGAVKLTYTYRF